MGILCRQARSRSSYWQAPLSWHASFQEPRPSTLQGSVVIGQLTGDPLIQSLLNESMHSVEVYVLCAAGCWGPIRSLGNTPSIRLSFTTWMLCLTAGRSFPTGGAMQESREGRSLRVFVPIWGQHRVHDQWVAPFGHLCCAYCHLHLLEGKLHERQGFVCSAHRCVPRA